MANAPLLLGATLCILLARFYLVLLRPRTRSKRPTREARETCSLGVFLGSGNANHAPSLSKSLYPSDRWSY